MLFASGLIFQAFLYNFYLQSLGLTAAVMGHAKAAGTIGSLVTLLPAGRLADRVGARLTVLVGTLTLTLGLCAGAFVTTPAFVYATAIIAGSGSGFWRVTIAPLLMRIADPRLRARAFAWNTGLLMGWGGVGVALAGALSTWLEERWGMGHLSAIRSALLLGALGSGVSAFLFLALPGSPAVARNVGMPEAMQPIIDSPPVMARVLPRIVLLAVWGIGPALVVPFLNIFLSRARGLSIAGTGYVMGASSVGWSVALLASAEIATWFGVRRTLVAALLGFVPAILGMSLVRSLELTIAFFFLQGVMAPLADPLSDQWLLGMTPSQRQGAVSSWRQVSADVGAIIGSMLGGWILAGGTFDSLFVVAGAIACVGALGVWASGHAVSGADEPSREPVAK